MSRNIRFAQLKRTIAQICPFTANNVANVIEGAEMLMDGLCQEETEDLTRVSTGVRIPCRIE